MESNGLPVDMSIVCRLDSCRLDSLVSLSFLAVPIFYFLDLHSHTFSIADLILTTTPARAVSPVTLCTRGHVTGIRASDWRGEEEEVRAIMSVSRAAHGKILHFPRGTNGRRRERVVGREGTCQWPPAHEQKFCNV